MAKFMIAALALVALLGLVEAAPVISGVDVDFFGNTRTHLGAAVDHAGKSVGHVGDALLPGVGGQLGGAAGVATGGLGAVGGATGGLEVVGGATGGLGGLSGGLPVGRK